MSGPYGPAVVDGRIRYLSVSSVSSFDARQVGGCPTRWWYKYVDRRAEPETKAQALGTALHKEIEHYLLTGERALGSLALAGVRYIPEPGLDLLIEQEISAAIGSKVPFSAIRLTAAGLPFVGKIDVTKFRPQWIAPDGEGLIDEPDTVEKIDWKSTSDWQYAKTGPELLRTVQMPGYAEWGFRTWPTLKRARLSHVYFLTRGAPAAKKATILVSRDEVARSWECVEAVAGRMIQTARETRAEAVEPNLQACRAYRGCPHQAYCPHAQMTSLTRAFGGELAMSLLTGNLFQAGAVPGAPAAPAAPIFTPPPANVVPIMSPAGVGVAIDMQAQVDALRAEEARAAAARAATPPAPEYPPGFLEALDFVRSEAPTTAGVYAGPPHGHGFPITSGKLGDLIAQRFGWNVPPGTVHNGTGELLKAKIQLTQPEQMIQLAGELRGVAPIPVAPPAAALPPQQAGVPAVLPPDAPASNPALASTPAPAPVVPAAAAAAASGAPPVGPSEAVATPKKRGRPKKAANVVQGDGVEVLDGPVGFELFVDCIPSCEHASLQPIVDQWVELLRSTSDNGTGAVPDIRCADRDHPLGFNKWKGALAAFVRMVVPKTSPGAYVLDTRGSEINEVIAETLRGYCEASGGVFVRGFR